MVVVEPGEREKNITDPTSHIKVSENGKLHSTSRMW